MPERLDRDRWPDRQIDRNTSGRRRFSRQRVDLDDVVDVEPKGGICVGILSNVVPVDGQQALVGAQLASSDTEGSDSNGATTLDTG